MIIDSETQTIFFYQSLEQIIPPDPSTVWTRCIEGLKSSTEVFEINSQNE